MIPIDEQIRLLTQAIEYPSPSSADPDSEPICIVCPDDAKAILASLERLKAIDAVQVPEEPEEVKAHLRYADPYDHVRKHIDTLRDLLKRETARADSYVSGAELAAITILRERAEAAEAKLAAIKEQSHD